jgi:hypothetical protein
MSLRRCQDDKVLSCWDVKQRGLLIEWTGPGEAS